MALNKASMAASIKTKMAAIPLPDGTAASAQAYRDALIEAMCDGIISEITQHAAVSVVTLGSATTQSCANGTIA